MKPIYKKTAVFLLVLSLFLGLFLATNSAGAALSAWDMGRLFSGPLGQISLLMDKSDVVNNLAQSIFDYLADIILNICQYFLSLTANIFNIALNNTAKVLEYPVVHDGWTITRDIVNMFFILGLVFIAFATILRLETYGMKALLAKIVIAALLINFSFLVCGIIIDASQIATDFFVQGLKRLGDNDKGDIGTIIGDQALRVKPRQPVYGVCGNGILELREECDDGNTVNGDGCSATCKNEAVSEFNQGSWAFRISTMLFSALTIFLAGLIFLIGAVLLIIRMAALAALIILVPFAWFFSVFPMLKKMSDSWWHNFLKYTFFAPAFVFFIYLAVKLAIALQMPTAPYIDSSAGFSAFMGLMFEYSIVIILLFGAPMVAMSMGIYGSQALIGAAKGALKATAKMPLKIQKAAATMVPPAWMEKKVRPLAGLVRGLQRTAAFTSPEFWKKAREARKAERRRKARIGYIIGKQQDILNLIYSLGSEKTSYAEQAEQFEVVERKKEIEAETKRVGARLIAKQKEALKQKDVVTYKSCLELLQEQGDTNDAMIFSDMFDEIKYDDKYALDELKGKNINDPNKRRFSNLGFKHGVIQQMRQMGLSDKQIAPFLGKMQEIGLRTGYFGLYGMVDADKETGEIKIASDEKHINTAAYKYKVLTPRMRTSLLHTTSYMKQGGTADHYEFVDWDEVGKYGLLKVTSLGDVAKMNTEYVRPDTRDAFAEGFDDLEKRKELEAIGEAPYKLGEKFSVFKKTGKDPLPAKPEDETKPKKEAEKKPGFTLSAGEEEFKKARKEHGEKEFG